MKCKQQLVIISCICFLVACKKLVSIDPPVNTIVSEQAFSNDNNANSSINGIYSKLINQSGTITFGNSAVTMLEGISSDEISFIGGDADFDPMAKNQLLATNNLVLTRLWQQPYEIIYQANACLEQLIGNKNLTPSLRDQYIGEAKFLRAFVYFYLINNFGDVPYLTSTDYKANTIAPRTSQSEIYSNLKSDLQDAINLLPKDFSSFGNERIRATKWAAMALLSRISLYTNDWDNAIKYSDQVINSSYFSLVSDLNSVFLKNSNEAIFQLYIDGTINPYNVLPESSITLPPNHNTYVYFYFPTSFLNEFEMGDKRKISWIDSTKYSGVTYYYPSKYKVGPSQSSPNSSPSEYYMVLRLAEQYFIRAEAQAQKDNLSSAASDVNAIRARSGLGPISFTSKDDAVDKILAERKKELFYEWGSRWFDLKRTGKIDAVMTNVTPQKGGTWNSTAKLFPIPAAEIFRNPKLIQNPGY